MVATRITVAEFEATCGDERVEVIDGVVVQMPAGSFGSVRVSATIARLLWTHVHPRKLGSVLAANAGFAIFPDRETVVAPDAAFIQAGREPQGDARWHFARLAPNLVAEVISPSDRASDMQTKVALYQEAGVPLVWVVDPQAQTVTVLAPGVQPHVLAATNTLEGGQVLPDFQVSVAEIFALLRRMPTHRDTTSSPA